ncbi:sulfur carrier protein ThiS [Vibrio renipiscarius]|uniref:Thiamine biosynthesis protein ThiS n=1 Tax=Vibrio renipiscarius TaxID=1461322 RepID=A0A0C2P207_9VIBR|nr:sulfur carrier protein ThiS [Vibrio renipiscarius]KII78643.1 thiamine biosynthesis protein ThiS [Vibrio renipiscarius]KII82410.1 thiamine biosynthesis protein ThiS [Vibrio renipiscarius]
MNVMTIYVNQTPQEITGGGSLENVISLLGLPHQSCVFAIKNQVVPRSVWASTLLCEGDEISLFQAIAGG